MYVTPSQLTYFTKRLPITVAYIAAGSCLANLATNIISNTFSSTALGALYVAIGLGVSDHLQHKKKWSKSIALTCAHATAMTAATLALQLLGTTISPERAIVMAAATCVGTHLTHEAVQYYKGEPKTFNSALLIPVALASTGSLIARLVGRVSIACGASTNSLFGLTYGITSIAVLSGLINKQWDDMQKTTGFLAIAMPSTLLAMGVNDSTTNPWAATLSVVSQTMLISTIAVETVEAIGAIKRYITGESGAREQDTNEQLDLPTCR